MELNPDKAFGRLKHVLSSRDFTFEILTTLVKNAKKIKKLMEIRNGRILLLETLKGFNICSLFIQPSTRSRLSGAVALSGLGAYVFGEVGTQKDGEWQLTFSSAVKGPSFSDEILALASLQFNMLMLRTPKVGMPEVAARVIDQFKLNVSVVNYGDGEGDGEHPTQSMLDFFTLTEGLGLDIERDWNNIKKYRIVFINDNRNNRAVRSGALLFGKLLGMGLGFVNPPGLEPEERLQQELRTAGVEFIVSDKFIPADVAYVTRIPKEFDPERFTKYRDYYSVTKQIADVYGYKGVMHPWPRSEEGNELPAYDLDKPSTERISLDFDNRGWYLRQMQNAVPTRMALALFLLDPTLDLNRLEEQCFRHRILGQCVICKRLERGNSEEWRSWDKVPYSKKIGTLPQVICEDCRP